MTMNMVSKVVVCPCCDHHVEIRAAIDSGGELDDVELVAAYGTRVVLPDGTLSLVPGKWTTIDEGFDHDRM